MSEQYPQQEKPNMASSNTPENEEDENMENPSGLELETEATDTPEHAAQNYESFSDEMEEQAPSPETQEPNADQLRIKVLEEQLDRAKEQMMRALADAENTRKRSVKERQDASKFAVSNFARDILSVADNLRRALESIPEETIQEFPQLKSLTEGIEATERELMRIFEKNGIVKLEPLEEMFDPNFHEVMFEAPMPDKESGTVIQVIEPGYTINERILRPARVGVAKNPDAPPPEGAGTGMNIDTEA